MPINSTGVKTHRDHFVFDFDKAELSKRISNFRNLELSDGEIAERYDLKDTSSFNLSMSRQFLLDDQNWQDSFTECLYRPFDVRHYYHNENLVDRSRQEVMQHLMNKDNLCLGLGRQGIAVNDDIWHLITCSSHLVDTNAFRRGGINIFPLYLYPTEKTGLFTSPGPNTTRKPNFSDAFIQDLETRLHLQWLPEGHGDFEKTISALDVFNYMYAVFHSPTYRQRYAEFLKIDFPRLPLTSDPRLFKSLAELGGQLVQIHLMETEIENECSFPVQGSNLVEKLVYKEEKVYINKTQYFDHVTPAIWEFHIGGYQVCEKWLKDRKGRVLSFDECSRYLYILAAVEKTREVMGRIDETIPNFPI
jgi:predicted helicase